MRKSTLLKIAMTLTAMFFISGVFAQINLTVKNSDGSAANGAIVYTINSSTGTVSADLFTDGAGTDADGLLNGVIRFTPVANTNYIVRNAAGNAWNTFSGSADATVVLRANFTVTMNDYVSGYNADKITISKSMPLWVYPSPVHNPSWTAPAANYATEAAISQPANLLSTFTWNIGGGADGSTTANDNYVELTFGTVGVKTVTVQEAAATAYGGCTGPLKTFYVNVINPPYLDFTNAADNTPAYTIGGAAANIILSECESVGTPINPTIDATNTDEEYPYYIKLKYRVFNATISAGNDITILPATEGTPGNVVNGHVTPAVRVSPTNPLIIDGTVGKTFPYSFFGAAVAFTTINNGITVYEFDLASAAAPTGGWNAGISRKSDYLAFRNNQPAANAADWADARYSWITDDNGGANQLKAYIVILPAPATGPIYHIPNTWGL